jgi:hypothetical protein
MTRRSGMTIAMSVGLMATVLCATSGSAGAVASPGQLSAAAVPGAPFAQASSASTLDFAGYPWTVKSSTSPVGPGPNVFDANGPFVDSSGALHLQIVQTPTGWESSEVILDPTLGYGTYRWTVDGPLSTLDPNVVFSLFTYDDSDTSPSNREIDFEASRFADAGEPTNAQYVVQPYETPGNLRRITLPASDVTTVVMTWLPGSVSFSAGSLPPWTNSTSSVPTSSTEQVHMSLWSFFGAPPSNGLPVSVEVTDFRFTASTPTANIGSPADDQTYSVGQSVPTSFACSEGADDSAISTCLDSNGSTGSGMLDTSRPGTYTYTATATDGDGGKGSSSITYSVVSAAPVSPPPAPPQPQPQPQPQPHGYWLVGSDGGIFTFGSAAFHGSTGNLKLNRPIVGITPTVGDAGYWLVGSDGGVFAFGGARFYGSVPGLGLAPAGTTVGRHLDAPIVGVVPSIDDRGYFMVASDGGVFAFGDARFEGSCPGIGGCSGQAVAVAPDASGRGYWVVTSTGHVYSFGDAPYFGAPGPQASAATSMVRTPNGGGYWILDADGRVFNYGDANRLGSLAANTTGESDPAAAIVATADGGGYWVVSALGAVYPLGDAPSEGSVSGKHLNGRIIAATGS